MEQPNFKKETSSITQIESLLKERDNLRERIKDPSLSDEESEDLYNQLLEIKKKKNLLEDEVAISEMEQPLKKILDQIRDSIAHGEYATIIGDDASGRAPALVLNAIIKKEYAKSGREMPQMLFIGGAGNSDVEQILPHTIDRGLKEENIHEHLQSHLKNKTGKVLIVTDYIETGVSLSSLVNAIDDIGCSHEIVSLSLGDVSSKDELEEKLGKIYDGGDQGIPKIYRKYRVSGVMKEPRTVLAHPAIHEGMIDSQSQVSENRRKIGELTHGLQSYYDNLIAE